MRRRLLPLPKRLLQTLPLLPPLELRQQRALRLVQLVQLLVLAVWALSLRALQVWLLLVLVVRGLLPRRLLLMSPLSFLVPMFPSVKPTQHSQRVAH